MSTQSLITDQMKRLLAQQQNMPVPSPVPMNMAQPMAPLPMPAAPQVANVPNATDLTNRRLLTDQNELRRLQTSGSGIDQITKPVDAPGNPTGAPVSGLRKFGGALARIGDTALSIVAPGAAALTPGTSLHHRLLLNQQEGYVNNDLANQKEQAETTLLDAQPQLKSQALENQLLKTQGTIQHQQDMLDLGQEKARQTYAANLRNHGYTIDETDPSGQKVRPLRYEEMSDQQQAVEDLKHSQSELAEANAALKKAQNDPTSPAFRLAQARLAVAQQNANTAVGRLGLSSAEFSFNQDKFYNPQPTAQERSKGDLAQSALERVQEMKQIAAKHPEWFGPIAGRAQNAQMAIGNQDPDMQTYQSAAQYLADHSAGVFGGRGQYILSQLHAITDPHSNPAAIQAALDEAERAAGGFVAAGKVHGKGGSSGYAGGNNGGPKEGDTKKNSAGDSVKFHNGAWGPA